MTEQACGVYFIDQYNYPSLCESAYHGDKLAVGLVRSLSGFLDQAPPLNCTMCHTRVPDDDIGNMTVVILCTDQASLTTWICEACAGRNDLDAEIEKIARRWPVIPKNASITVEDPKTLH